LGRQETTSLSLCAYGISGIRCRLWRHWQPARKFLTGRARSTPGGYFAFFLIAGKWIINLKLKGLTLGQGVQKNAYTS